MKCWLWKKYLAQANRTVNSYWLYLLVEVEADVLSGPPMDVPRLHVTTKAVVPLLQVSIVVL